MAMGSHPDNVADAVLFNRSAGLCVRGLVGSGQGWDDPKALYDHLRVDYPRPRRWRPPPAPIPHLRKKSLSGL